MVLHLRSAETTSSPLIRFGDVSRLLVPPQKEVVRALTTAIERALLCAHSILTANGAPLSKQNRHERENMRLAEAIANNMAAVVCHPCDEEAFCTTEEFLADLALANGTIDEKVVASALRVHLLRDWSRLFPTRMEDTAEM
jgi:hypothetical protein